MLNISDLLSNPETTKYLLKRCDDFRGSVLRPPDEMALAAHHCDMALPPRWGIRSVLRADKVEDLYSGCTSSIRVAVQEWLPDLPCLMLDVPCRHCHFLWVVPLEEDGAREWLETVAVRERFTLLLDAEGGSRSIAMASNASLSCDLEAMLKAATVQPMVSQLASLEAMVISGFRAMLDRASSPQDLKCEVRTMVVAQDGNDQPILKTFLRSGEEQDL